VIEGEATDLTPPEAGAPAESLAEVQASEEASAEAAYEEPTAEAAATEPEAAAEPVAEPQVAAEPAFAPPPPPAPPPAGFGVGKALGLVVIVAAAALGGAYVAPLLTGEKQATEDHFGAIDAALKDEATARKALEARIAKLENASVSATAVAAASKPAPAASPTAAASVPATAATPDPQVAKLETTASALADRVEKLEAALATQKSEARADPVAKEKTLDPVAEAVAAISLAQRLGEGAPFATEFAALSKAGADAGALAALKPYADSGAPTPGKLAAAFAKIAPGLSAPAKTEGKGEVVDEVMDKLRGLVKVHVVSEVPGDDPAALASQISAALARGDVAAALAIEAKLPEPARTAAAPWAADAHGLENATAAARTLAETALKRFAEAKS